MSEPTAQPVTAPVPVIAPLPEFTPPAASPRYHHLDALRGLLMVWGIVVHAGTLGPSATFDAIAKISGFVRMEAFYVISGLLTGLVAHRTTAAVLRRRRFLTLGLPLLFGLLVLNPPTLAMIRTFHAPASGPSAWHLHLWFLFPLLIYTLLTTILHRLVIKTRALSAAPLQQLSPAQLLPVLALLVALSCLAGRVAYELLVEPYLPITTHFIIRSTLYYLPLFTLGMFLSAPETLAAFSRVNRFQLIASLSTIIIITITFSTMPKLVAETLLLLSEAYLAVVLTAALFYAANKWFKRPRRAVTAVATASYTIYMLHFMFIYTWAFILPDGLRGTLLMVTVAVATFITTTILHHALVARIQVFALVLNGRSIKTPPEHGIRVSPMTSGT